MSYHIQYLPPRYKYNHKSFISWADIGYQPPRFKYSHKSIISRADIVFRVVASYYAKLFGQLLENSVVGLKKYIV
jgi:hypothetical protein